ncbi:MAG: DUF3558 family protein [Pseudonocardiaceae bacterium]
MGGTLVLGALVVGCGQSVAGAPTESADTGSGPANSALASFDPCTVLSDAEIAGLGFMPETRRTIDMLGQVGCGYTAPPFDASGEIALLGGLRLEKDPVETVADYAARSEGIFDSFRPNRVNGRTGAALEVVADGIECTQLVNAGTGTVAVGWRFRDPAPVDPCAEALRVAVMIEPELPAVGS